jgi:hypothetical protein
MPCRHHGNPLDVAIHPLHLFLYCGIVPGVVAFHLGHPVVNGTPPLELVIGDEVKYYEYPYTFGDTRGLRIQRVKNIEVAYHKE